MTAAGRAAIPSSRSRHSHGLIDESIKRSREGLKAVGFSLAVLGLTALAQVAIFLASGSVALLADLIHNFGDAATAFRWALVIVAGGSIGSFTTFSTWMLDSHRLNEAGHTHLVWLNIGLSLVVGFAAIALGHWIDGGSRA